MRDSGTLPHVSLQQRFAENVRRERLKRQWTQEEAAERAGLDARTWQKVEACEAESQGPTLRTVERIARGLGVAAKDLL